MEPLALKLEMLKGPREGETLEYRPGSKIRIGRVVRGNNLPIKDSGISTNHLIIESESGRWTVRDLDSSNGTIVNDSAVDPNTPLELHDGDEIKIGEYTSISVKIECREEESRLRRNPRRAALGKAGLDGRRGRAAQESELKVKLEVEKENVEEIGGAAARVLGRRGRAAKKIEVSCELEKEVEEIEAVEKPKRGRGRPRKAKVLKSVEDLVEEEEEEVAVPEVSSRAVQRSKNAELVSCSVECEEVKIEPKRRGRKRKDVQEQKLVCEKGNVAAEEKDLGEVALVGFNGNDEDTCGVLEQNDSGEAVLIGTNGGNESRGDVPEQKSLEGIDLVEDDDAKGLDYRDETCENAAVGVGVGESGDDNEKSKGYSLGHVEAAASECDVGESGDKVESGSRSCSSVSGAKDVDEKGSGSGVKEVLGNIWQEEPDLEKMTLDDWFDCVEVSWAKVVNGEIDKICAGMREKARLVQECIAQHKREKGQS